MERFVNQFIRDRRVSERHPLRTALRVRLRKSSIPEQRAYSENLSDRGVFFVTDLPVQLNTSVDVLLKMPRAITGMPSTEWLCTGHVVRIERLDSATPDKLGVGVRFDCYQVSNAA